ncbi:hypothetical protein POTOM_003310 [Populus tomentosa]|uniref:Retrovirus-related Pol polyprotein from transposon TNT 1-94-like beta-barrel domain-containing protein n=1 Tax=Populus tomentosa TaxID=118781 RepID=A0A8X8DLI6_POPTO|nr:hypothetical protein POTOM_003310 [Populus tomentosa]
MVSEPSITMTSSSSVHTMLSASSLETTLPKSHLPDISIKLASNNYLLWKAQVLPVLRGYGLLGYVKDEVPCPESTIIGENVINSESSHDAWQVLETLFGTHTRDRIQQIKGELQSLTKGNSSLEDYLQKAKALALSLCGAGKPMDDDEFIICILRGLVAALNARDTFPSLEGIIGKLRDFEIRIQGARTTAPSIAFYTNSGRTNSKPWINNNTHGRNNHSFTTRNLPNNTPLRAKETRFPRQNGSFNGIRQKQVPYNSNRGRGSITCFRCGGPNHKADGCFASDEEADQYKAFAAIKIRETTEDPWYPNTRANQHMTSNTNEVQGITSYPGNDSVMVGNGQDLHITGTGNVTIPTTSLKLKDVLVVPEIKKKLLSVCQFTRDNNCYFLFYPWGFILKDMKTKQFPYKCMQPPDIHASQLFRIKAFPRLLKTVADKTIAKATQVSPPVPPTIVPHTDPVHEASASQPAASTSVPSSTATENLVPPVMSLASAPPPQRQHHMITRTQTGKLKPKTYDMQNLRTKKPSNALIILYLAYMVDIETSFMEPVFAGFSSTILLALENKRLLPQYFFHNTS